MNRRTLGYIVVGGDDTPLRWYPNERRFYKGVFNGPRNTASVFLASGYDYEDVRRSIAVHYATISRQPYAQHASAYNLRIVRLTDALGFE